MYLYSSTLPYDPCTCLCNLPQGPHQGEQGYFQRIHLVLDASSRPQYHSAASLRGVHVGTASLRWSAMLQIIYRLEICSDANLVRGQSVPVPVPDERPLWICQCPRSYLSADILELNPSCHLAFDSSFDISSSSEKVNTSRHPSQSLKPELIPQAPTFYTNGTQALHASCAPT